MYSRHRRWYETLALCNQPRKSRSSEINPSTITTNTRFKWRLHSLNTWRVRLFNRNMRLSKVRHPWGEGGWNQTPAVTTIFVYDRARIRSEKSIRREIFRTTRTRPRRGRTTKDRPGELCETITMITTSLLLFRARYYTAVRDAGASGGKSDTTASQTATPRRTVTSEYSERP